MINDTHRSLLKVIDGMDAFDRISATKEYFKRQGTPGSESEPTSVPIVGNLLFELQREGLIDSNYRITESGRRAMDG